MAAMIVQHVLVAFSVAAILAPFSYYMGHGARLLKLPQITGYLISGIMCGPYLLGILSKESVADLNIIEGACLSIIGLAAGAELHLGELSRSKKQVRGEGGQRTEERTASKSRAATSTWLSRPMPGGGGRAALAYQCRSCCVMLAATCAAPPCRSWASQEGYAPRHGCSAMLHSRMRARWCQCSKRWTPRTWLPWLLWVPP